MAVGLAAAVDLEVGAAVLHGAVLVAVGDEAALAEGPGLAVGAGAEVDGAEEGAGGLGVEVAADRAVEEALHEVVVGERELVAGEDAGVPGGELGVDEGEGELVQHGVHGGGEGGDGGGDVARGGLDRAADLDDAGLDGAGAAVVVVVLALAELAAARAAADVAVGGVVAGDVLADDQAGAVDEGEEGLALGLAQEQVVDVIGGRRAAVRVIEAGDDEAEAGPGGEAGDPVAEA